MNDDGQLFDPAYRVTERDQLVGPEKTIEAAFWRFHRANPQVYEQLVALARTWVARRPGQKLGVKMLFERLRWDLAMRTTGEELKLNNNYHSYYARLIMSSCPDLEGLFETRRLRAREPELEASDGQA